MVADYLLLLDDPGMGDGWDEYSMLWALDVCCMVELVGSPS